MNNQGQALIYQFNTGLIQEINKDKFISLMLNAKITTLTKQKLLQLSYQEIIDLHKNIKKLAVGIYGFSIDVGKTVAICLLGKTYNDFKIYCKKNNWPIQDNSNNIIRDKKINIVYLMHKNDKVCKYQTTQITEDCKLLEVYNIDLMPVGTVINNKVSEYQFSEWLKWRSIPYSRKNIKLILQALNIRSTEFMIQSCNGAGLNDLYWYKEEGSSLIWEDINFYDNEWYKEDSKLLFLKLKKGTIKVYTKTPDCVSIGNQPKCWIRENGHNYLLKADQSPIAMEAFTEEVMYEIMKSHKYTFYEDKQNDICCSKTINFMEDINNKGKDFVTANWYMQQYNYKNDTQYLILLLLNDIKEKMSISSYKNFLLMLIFDYIYMNSDRHLDNFGFIRTDINKFEFAPIYDNGDALSRGCLPKDSMCYLLKNDTSDVDRIIKLITPFINNFKEIKEVVIEAFNKTKEILDKYEDKYKNYDIKEYLNKKNNILIEMQRRFNLVRNL